MTRSLSLALTLVLTPLVACTEAGQTEAGADELGDGDSTSASDSTATETTATETTASETTASETSTSETTDTGDPNCTGPKLTQSRPAPTEPPATPTVPGSLWPSFELTDFQPQSCNFGQTYGLETFKGRVTLVSLMRSTCEICQGTIGYLEQMQIQLELEGHDVWFVVINQPGYESSQEEFITRASFPLLQDTLEVQAWELLNQFEPLQGTDDIYIYDAQGVLHSYFSYAADNPTIKLETPQGWDNVYNAILAAQ